jgi:hypothetical protein
VHLVDDEQVDGDELVDDVGLGLLGATGRRAERAAHGPRQVKPLHVPARPARLARALDDTDAKLSLAAAPCAEQRDEIAVVEPVEEQVADSASLRVLVRVYAIKILRVARRTAAPLPSALATGCSSGLSRGR